MKTDAGLNTTVTVALFLCGTAGMRFEIMAKMDLKNVPNKASKINELILRVYEEGTRSTTGSELNTTSKVKTE